MIVPFIFLAKNISASIALRLSYLVHFYILVCWNHNHFCSWSISFAVAFTPQYEHLLSPLYRVYYWSKISTCFIMTSCICIMVLSEITADISVYYILHSIVLQSWSFMSMWNCSNLFNFYQWVRLFSSCGLYSQPLYRSTPLEHLKWVIEPIQDVIHIVFGNLPHECHSCS